MSAPADRSEGGSALAYREHTNAPGALLTLTRGWRAAEYTLALAAVAAVTVLVGLVLERTRTGNLSMLYLFAVLTSAVLFGRGPAIAASVAAFLSYDFFFVEPVHHFTIADPAEYVALMLFLVTAVVTGTLAALQRDRAREAEARRGEAVVLYDVARLLSEPDVNAAFPRIAERLANELHLDAVVLQGPAEVQLTHGETGAVAALTRSGSTRMLSGAAGDRSPRWIRLIGPYRGRRRDEGGTHAVPVMARDARIGTLLVHREDGAAGFGPTDDRLLSTVGTQLGHAIERAELARVSLDAEILREADTLKSALLDAVSHDLRTPLASILTAAGSLRQSDVRWSDDERRELLDVIERQAERLDRLVGNLLDLSRIESGVFHPRKAWYDVGALVDDVVGRLRPITAAHVVIVRIADDLPPVELDYVEIDQVLTNLLENAVKYAPAGSEIELRARAAAGTLTIEVADRGPGIPEGESARIFEPFQRIRRGDGSSGTGLGLAVARRLVLAHGGRIDVAPRRGGGSRFVVTLPAGDGA